MGNSDKMVEMIRSATSFREIISLREKIWSLSGKVELNEFLNLRDRVEKKVNDIEAPLFGNVRIEVVFAQSQSRFIDQREVAIVVGKGMKLSEYVFREYPEAVDFKVGTSRIEETQESEPETDEYRIEINERLNFKASTIKESIQRILRLAVRLITFLFNTYSGTFPHLADDLRTIKEKLEILFESVSTAYY